MPTKPNMRMGGVDTQGDRGVMGAAMQTAQMKASAAKDSGLSAVAGQLSDWADDKMQEDRRIALEGRAETRGIAKEERVATREAGLLAGAQEREERLTAEKREYDEPLRSAQIKQAEATARKADRWEPASAGTTKTDNKDSTYTVDGEIITIGQAKVLQKEWEKSLPENSAEALDEAKRDIANVEKDMADRWFKSESQASAFIRLYEKNPQAAKAKDSEAFNELDRATQIKNRLESGMQGYIDSKYGGTTQPAAKPKVVFRPKT